MVQDNKFLVMFGPSFNPVTGQSFAFNFVAKHLPFNKKIFYFPSHVPILISIWRNIILLWQFLLFFMLNGKNVQCLYITSSRSNLGFIRDFSVICIARLWSTPMINHLHGADFRDFRNHSFLRPMIDFAYRKVACSIVLSPSMTEQYAVYPDMQLKVIPNFFEPVSQPTRSRVSEGPLKILYLSNIMYSKGIFNLIEAVNLLVNDGYKIRLNIAGHFLSDRFMNLEDTQDRFNASLESNFISYHGAVFGDEKNDLFLDSDVFCLPTFYPTEAQPISLIEAMSLGCYIITTQHNYICDFVSERNGMLVGPDSIQEIVEAIRFAYNNRSLIYNIGQANVSYAYSTFSGGRHIDSLTEVVNLLSERHS